MKLLTMAHTFFCCICLMAPVYAYESILVGGKKLKHLETYKEKCALSELNCIYKRVHISSQSKYVQLDSFMIKVNDESLGDRLIKINDNLVFLAYSCRNMQLNYIELIANNIPQEIAKKHIYATQLAGNPERHSVCYVGIDKRFVDMLKKQGSKDFELRISRTYIDSSPDGKFSLSFKPYEFGLNSFVITAGHYVVYYADSSTIKRPENTNESFRGMHVSGGAAFEMNLDSRAYLHISTFSSWSQFSMAYKKHEALSDAIIRAASMVSELKWDNNESEDKKINRTIDYLNKNITYKAFDLNSGLFLNRDFDVIFKSKVADCKESSLLLTALLEAQGVQATSIITSTLNSMPSSIALPDFSWANHVVVRIPSLNMYVDMTQLVGRQIVQNGAPILNHLGIDVSTGNFIVIQ